ncbi:AlpA family transcriptional regulator [Burkholderia pseudomallei]|uniref:helix-turn-helix transcriptional regulator n=1 Tax=Burkholderia pseudomallei TaxID=28450 RepID=UPI002934020E|nr:AlpA family transcriptional regulator [Burkholderia pseudomallei]MDV2081984.1 AlpA family transcriptional regulator [Burkholderia pseudomallei]
MYAKNHRAAPLAAENYNLPMDDKASALVVFLRRKVVEKRTGLSRSSLYAAIAKNEFPKPVPIGAKSVAWIEAEVSAWMHEKISQRV